MTKYQFEKWEDNSTNPSRVIDVNSNKEITAYYKLVSEVSYAPSDSPVGNATIIEPATQTTLTLDPLSVTAEKGTTTNFTGKLTDTGIGVAGKTISLYVDGVEVATAVTNADGSYAIDYTWTVTGSHTYQTKYLGD